MASSNLVEEAEAFYQQIVDELQKAGSSVKKASVTFDLLVALLRRLGNLNDELKTVKSRNEAESKELLARLDAVRRQLSSIIEKFPDGVLPATVAKGSGDALTDATTVEMGIWNMLQRLNSIETEHKVLTQTIASLKKEIDAERDRAGQIKKLINDAETLLKSILGNPKGTDSIGDMVNKVRQLIENERRGKVESQKQLDQCSLVISELEAEFKDVGKVLRQLYDKCAGLEQTVASLGVKGVAAMPAFRPDGDESEQFDEALAWITGTVEQLVAELRSTEKRQQEAEEKQKSVEANSIKTADKLKNVLATIADLQGKVQGAEGKLRDEKCIFESTTKSIEERRALYERHLTQLKQFYEDGQSRSTEMAGLLKTQLNELNEVLTRLKSETSSDESNRLVALIERLLAELQKLQQQFGVDTRVQEERGEELDREHEDLNRRLKTAREGLKTAEEKRRALIEELRTVKNQLNSLAESEHEMEDQLSPVNDERLKAQEEIARMKMENDRLRERVVTSSRTLETREQMIQKLRDKHAARENQFKDLEKESSRLRWRAAPPEQSGECSKCRENGPLKQEFDQLRKVIPEAKEENESSRRRVEEGKAEIERIKMDRSSRSSVASAAASEATTPSPSSAKADSDAVKTIVEVENKEERRSRSSSRVRSPSEEKKVVARREPEEMAAVGEEETEAGPSGMVRTGESTEGGGVTVKLNANVRLTVIDRSDENEEENGGTD